MFQQHDIWFIKMAMMFSLPEMNNYVKEQCEQKERKNSDIYAICFYYSRVIQWCQLNHHKYTQYTELKKRRSVWLWWSPMKWFFMFTVTPAKLIIGFAINSIKCENWPLAGCSTEYNQFNWPSKMNRIKTKDTAMIR